MNVMDTFFLWIGTHFTTEMYMVTTKVQGILWSLADILLIFFLLKIADLARVRTHRKRVNYRYLWLWFSALMTPLLLFTRTPTQFLILESIICGTQFFILVYTVIAERKSVLDLVLSAVESD